MYRGKGKRDHMCLNARGNPIVGLGVACPGRAGHPSQAVPIRRRRNVTCSGETSPGVLHRV